MRHHRLVSIVAFVAALGGVSYISGRLTAPTVPPNDTVDGVLAAAQAVGSGVDTRHGEH